MSARLKTFQYQGAQLFKIYIFYWNYIIKTSVDKVYAAAFPRFPVALGASLPALAALILDGFTAFGDFLAALVLVAEPPSSSDFTAAFLAFVFFAAALEEAASSLFFVFLGDFGS